MPAPTDPAVPLPVAAPEASEPTEVGALAFQVYWIRTLDYAWATLDVGPFAAVSAPECVFCSEGIVEFLGPRAGQGYVYEGGRYTILDTEVLQFEAASQAVVSSIISITDLRVTDPAGNPDPDSEGAHAQFQILNTLSWQGAGVGWLVTDSRGGDL